MKYILIILLALSSVFLQANNDSIQSLPCTIFPSNNIWNTAIDELPVDQNSLTYMTTIGLNVSLKADFGSGMWNGAPIGIPFVIVPGDQPKVNVTFDYSDESDAGPYPIPDNPPIEGGNQSDGDRHVLILDKDNCVLYEIYHAYREDDKSWTAGSGAIFDLNSNDLRPDSWTSADAAGLPILPGLVRYDEIVDGEINHAIRFTVPKTQRASLWPARHYASSITDIAYPPMGLRVRLKPNYDISGFSPVNQIILKALKKYGMILADNGSAIFISGVPDDRWDDDDLQKLKGIKGSDFEAVDVETIMINENSAEAKQEYTSVNSTEKDQNTLNILYDFSSDEVIFSDVNSNEITSYDIYNYCGQKLHGNINFKNQDISSETRLNLTKLNITGSDLLLFIVVKTNTTYKTGSVAVFR